MSQTKQRPRKRFGQNFLQEPTIIDAIVRAIAPQQGEKLIEIGPGRGALTFPILDMAGQLTAIEIDRDLIAPLEAGAKAYGQLTLLQQDALSTDYRALAGTSKLRIVGNLPYNISSPLIFHLLSQLDCIAEMFFMLQKEVVDRLTAVPGTKAYGRLAIMTGVVCHAESIMHVPPDAFYPQPKVDSAIVQLTPLATPLAPRALMPSLTKIVKVAFGQRRKTLRNSLGRLMGADHPKLEPYLGLRAENLSITDFIHLATYYAGPGSDRNT